MGSGALIGLDDTYFLVGFPSRGDEDGARMIIKACNLPDEELILEMLGLDQDVSSSAL